MYENLRGRVSRIISVGVSAVIGAIEGLSPEMVMEEAIQEVEDAAREVRDELDRVLAARHMAQKRLDEKNAHRRELDGQIAVAVAEGRDDLAEAGIAQQLDIEAQLPVLNETLTDLAGKERELHSFISALDAKKREMGEELVKLRRAKAAAAPAAQAGAGGTAGAPGKLPGDVAGAGRKASTAASAFDRIMARESGLPQTFDASMADRAKLADLSKLARENRIKERLAAFKAAKDR